MTSMTRTADLMIGNAMRVIAVLPALLGEVDFSPCGVQHAS